MLRLYSAPVRGEKKEAAEEGELLGRIFVFRDVTRETAVDRIKTEFVSTVSHELRTPLTAIKGYVDLMASGQTGPITEIPSSDLRSIKFRSHSEPDSASAATSVSDGPLKTTFASRMNGGYTGLSRPLISSSANRS